MIEPVIYKAIEHKNLLEQEMLFLSPEESLIHCLNMMDLHAVLKGDFNNDDSGSENKIKWIKLKLKNDK